MSHGRTYEVSVFIYLLMICTASPISGTTCDHTISGTTYLTYGSYYTNRGECEANAVTSLN